MQIISAMFQAYIEKIKETEKNVKNKLFSLFEEFEV